MASELQNYLQIGITGVAFGSIYALVGCGLLVTYLTSHALNFGLGSFLMVGAFVSMTMVRWGAPAGVAVAAAVALVSLLGILLEQIAIRPLSRGVESKSKSGVGWILTTLGAGLILQNVGQLIWGKSRFQAPPLF